MPIEVIVSVGYSKIEKYIVSWKSYFYRIPASSQNHPDHEKFYRARKSFGSGLRMSQRRFLWGVNPRNFTPLRETCTYCTYRPIFPHILLLIITHNRSRFISIKKLQRWPVSKSFIFYMNYLWSKLQWGFWLVSPILCNEKKNIRKPKPLEAGTNKSQFNPYSKMFESRVKLWIMFDRP